MCDKTLKEKHEALKNRRIAVKKHSDIIFQDVIKITEESIRAAEACKRAAATYRDLDLEFERITKFNKIDTSFLFFATALQCLRIYWINKLTKVEGAGKGKIEKTLKRTYKEWTNNVKVNENEENDKYFASKKHIISYMGVPYDVTKYSVEKDIREVMDIIGPLDGANHRFATLGHDPLLGFIFGTANILTNTITTVDKPVTFNKPKSFLNLASLKTFHVSYQYKHPEIELLDDCSSAVMFSKCYDRYETDREAVTYSIIKQAIHIGTDLYTTCGIQIPFANLVLSKANAEKLTKYISTGDLIKIGTNALLSIFINYLISVLHNLLYDATSNVPLDVYNVKTRRILMQSNLFASTSNVIWCAGQLSLGNLGAIKDVDFGGLMVTLYRLFTDTEFIRQVKYEFIINGIADSIKGKPLVLE